MQLLSPLRLQDTLTESFAWMKNNGSNQSDLFRANETTVYLMPSDICLLLFRPAYIGACATGKQWDLLKSFEIAEQM